MRPQIDFEDVRVAPSLHWFEEWSLWLRKEEYKRGGGRLEQKSLDAYQGSVQHFVHWFETVRPASAVLGIEFRLAHFTTEVLYEYFHWQEEQRVPAKSWNHRLTSLRKVVKWGMRMGYLQEDPTRVIGRIHQIEAAPRKIEKAAFTQLEDVAVSGSHLKRDTERWSKLGVRDRVIWHLFCAGLRVGEVANVDLRDVDLDQGRLRVIGKGRVEGSVILTTDAVKAIRDWLALRSGLRLASVEWKLLTDWNGRGITAGQVRRRLQQMGAQANVPVRPHDLRHTTVHNMLSDLLRQGWDLHDALRATADQARHRDIRTTWGYLRVPEAQVRAALEAR